MLEDGRYSIVYASGDYRTIRIRTKRPGQAMAGAHVLSIKEGHTFRGVGFLNADNAVYFWKSVRLTEAPERLSRIARAVQLVAADPQKAQMAYGMKENRCARCGLALTVPASINCGLGPECARKGQWTKADQREAYQTRKSQAA